MLSEAEKTRGVISASAGNHALGLAYHGHQLGDFKLFTVMHTYTIVHAILLGAIIKSIDSIMTP
jgi:threonine dehydratase